MDQIDKMPDFTGAPAYLSEAAESWHNRFIPYGMSAFILTGCKKAFKLAYCILHIKVKA